MEDLDRLDIKACLDGDDEAYRRLVERHQQQVARLMWRFSRNKGVIEELVQETFVQAYMSLSGFRGDGSFAGWLSRIATRVGYRFWKSQAKNKAHYQLDETEVIEEADDSQLNPATAGRVIEWLLEQLGDADRLVLTLMYFESCRTEDIAQRMGWTRGMVKMRAFRARRKLKAIADRHDLWEKLGWII